MISSKLKVVHTADIQIEVRNSQQRYTEFEYVLSVLEKAVKEQQADLYFIVGDIFETCRPNDVERSLFVEHLHRVLAISTLKEVVITYGNHDVDQKKESNFYLSNKGETPADNSLDTIVKSIASPKLMLLERSQSYLSRNIQDLEYINWSQKSKHSDVLDESYNPIDNCKLKEGTTKITFYHDPIFGCKMFDDQTLRNNENFCKLSNFHTPVVFAGDIHQPQEVSSGSCRLIYPGSPVARNYGEGDYYRDGKLFQNGNFQHSYFVCELNPNGTISSEQWVQVPPYRSYNTFIVTNEVQPSGVLLLNWDIANKGMVENLVHVKLPAATESWISKEADIIEEIRKTSFNSQISFLYGKGITVDEETFTNTEQIHELITREKLLETAKEYIHKQVTASRSITSEDKEDVEKKINELFLSELDALNTSIVSNRIKLMDIGIRNFMAYGDDCNIEFKESAQGINRLVGGNGIGKTTLYKAIKWVLTGYISQSQNKTKKNENNLAVFNDYRYNTDSTTVFLGLQVNDERGCIMRSVSREWKKGTTDEQKKSKNWKSYVSGTAQMLEFSIGGKKIVQEEAEEILECLFGGLQNLERIVFADQFTLQSFVRSEPQRLCEEILNHIGMNFFTDMEERYDALRDKELSSLSKPSKQMNVLRDEVVSKELDVVTYEEKKKEIDKSISEHENTIQEINERIEKLSSELVPGISEDSINNKETTANYKLSVSQESIENLDKQKKQIQKLLESSSLEENERIQKLRKAEIEKLESQINDLASNKAEIQIAIKKKESEIFEIKAGIKEKLNSEIQLKNKALQEQQETLSKIKVKITELTTKLESLKTLRKQEFIDTINNAIATITNVETIKKSQEEQLEDCNAKIGQLKNSEICPTCKRRLDEHSIEEIQKEIAVLQEKKTKTETVIENCLKKIANIEAEKLEYKNRLAEIEQDPEKFIGEEYTHTMGLLEKTKHLEDIYENQIREAKNAIEGIEALLNKSFENNDSIKKCNAEIQKMNESVAQCEINIENIRKTITITKLDLSAIETAITNYHKYKDDIAELDKSILKLQVEVTEAKSELKQIELDKISLSKNKELEGEITDLKVSLASVSEKLDESRAEKNMLLSKIATINSDIEKLRADIDNAIQYRIVESSLKQYKSLIGKSGLPQHIFRLVKGVLNSKLNDLLEDLNFRLQFNDDNQLVMLDLTKSSIPQRYPSQFSGMQTCFAGLSLLYVNRICNNTFLFDTLFIDEISGQLNSGEDLSYESFNYQEQLNELLKKFVGMNIWIVDHVIKDLEVDHTYEVVPSADGAYIEEV